MEMVKSPAFFHLKTNSTGRRYMSLYKAASILVFIKRGYVNDTSSGALWSELSVSFSTSLPIPAPGV